LLSSGRPQSYVHVRRAAVTQLDHPERPGGLLANVIIIVIGGGAQRFDGAVIAFKAECPRGLRAHVSVRIFKRDHQRLDRVFIAL